MLLDSQEQFAGPVRCYRDGRKDGMMEVAFSKIPRSKIFEATGLQFIEINSLFQLLGAVEANDPSLGIAESYMMMGDFFHWLLTGKQSIEATNASTSHLLDPRDKTWRFDLMEKLKIPKKLFCDVTEPGTTLGPIQRLGCQAHRIGWCSRRDSCDTRYRFGSAFRFQQMSLHRRSLIGVTSVRELGR